MCKINTIKLVEMRKSAGMTQDELAKKVGISRSTINQYEKVLLDIATQEKQKNGLQNIEP